MKPKLAKKHEPGYFLRLAEDSPEEGPFSIEVLRQMANDGEISSETWFRPEGEESYRQLGEDPPLAADLWPEEEPFDPEAAVNSAVAPVVAEAETDQFQEHSGNVGEILEGNVERERARRLAAGETEEAGVDWGSLFAWKGVVVRWVLAIASAALGVKIWLESTGHPYDFFYGFGLALIAIVLTVPETLRLVTAPFAWVVDTLFEGGGAGSADFWTADSLMAQGEYKLAVAEYRRIAIQHPRELDAYLKGVKAARALANEREVERFRELAMKNLKSEQDRNLFLSALERGTES